MEYLINTLFIFFGLTLLVIGGEFLVRASVALSLKLNLSKMIIGLTVVSFATSAPELIVSINAALDGFSDLSLGNVIGSNIANIGLVLGITAFIATLHVDREFLRFNWPVMMLLSIGLYFILKQDGVISRFEGIVLLTSLFIYLWVLISRAKRAKIPNEFSQEIEEEIDESLTQVSSVKIFIWLLIGGISLWGGSELLVKGAVEIATLFNVSERVIAVTMVAVGTSVPELAASVIAALKQEKAISLGNLIGSNIFNITSVLGITAIIQPIVMKSDKIVSNDLLWMLGFAAILIPFTFLPKKYAINRYKGLILFIGYASFTALAFI
jgi:cation:H+ antiporter